ncbi:MAG: 2-(1,2-epoxy,2-dihydrophenyl)acetyl-CoA isomerase [Acidimicrobiaceae bacterium]
MSDPTLEEQVLHRVEDGVAWITLNRPDVANAVTFQQRNHIIDLLDAASTDYSVRAVVLTANGRHFCTGADLRAAQPVIPKPEGAPDMPNGFPSRNIRAGAQRLVGAVLDCEKPVIGAINGTAAGIGAHLAFACDLVIAAETSKFIEVFVRRGIIPDGGGAYLLPRIIGVQKTKELMFFGDDVPAAEALRLGLVNKVVPGEELLKEAGAWAARLAQGPTRAIALTKWLVNRSLDSERGGAFYDESHAQELVLHTADADEGVKAFVERRDPSFQGW